LAGELKHKDVGPELTYAEYHATDSHTIDGVDAGTVIAGKATLAEVKADTDVATAITNSHASGSDNQVIPDELADLSDDATHRLVTDTEKSTWNGKTDLATVKADTDVASSISLKHTQGTDQGLDTGGLNAVTAAEVKGAVTNSHAPGSDNQTIPDQLSDLSDDATHRLVTDTEKSTWNGKTDLSTVKADTDVASAISLKHTQGTDQGLDTGGANAVTAAQAKAGYTHSGVAHAPSDAVSLSTVKADADVSDAISKKHSAVTVSAPISLSGQALSLVNDAAAAITEIDTGALANSDTVIPTSKAVTTAIAGVGGVTDHGDLTGLADDDHTQYIKHSLATAANDFLVASGSGTFVKKTLAETKAVLELPKFMVVLSSAQNIPISTWTKVAFATEVYDIGSKYDTTNYRWVPGIVGKANLTMTGYYTAVAADSYLTVSIYKNGSAYKNCVKKAGATADDGVIITSDVLVDNTSDYFEIWLYQDAYDPNPLNSNTALTSFSGHMLL
jgi:hypothetical protein